MPSSTPTHTRSCVAHAPLAHSTFSLHPSPSLFGPMRHDPAPPALMRPMRHCSRDAGAYGFSASGFWNWHASALPTVHGCRYTSDSSGPDAHVPAYDTPAGRAFITTTLENLKIARGANAFATRGTFALPDAVASPVARGLSLELFGRFLSQVDSNCTLEGFDAADGGPGSSSASALLQPALARLVAPAAFPGIPSPLLTSAIIYTDTADLPTAAAEPTTRATVRLTNPLSVNITMREANMTMFLCGAPKTDARGLQECGAYQARLGSFYNGSLVKDFNGGLVAPERSNADFNLTLTNRADEGTLAYLGYQFLFNPGVVLGKGNGTVSVRLTDTFNSTPFDITVAINQYAVPICVKGVLSFPCDFSKAAPATPNAPPG